MVTSALVLVNRRQSPHTRDFDFIFQVLAALLGSSFSFPGEVRTTTPPPRPFKVYTTIYTIIDIYALSLSDSRFMMKLFINIQLQYAFSAARLPGAAPDRYVQSEGDEAGVVRGSYAYLDPNYQWQQASEYFYGVSNIFYSNFCTG